MNPDTNMERFLQLVEKTPSAWLEDVKWREDNRSWLDHAFEIAMRCLRVMRAQGITQKELAERMEVTPQQVSKILKGKENLTLKTISQLEEALNTPLIEVTAPKSYSSSYASTFYNVPAIGKPVFHVVASSNAEIHKKTSILPFPNVA